MRKVEVGLSVSLKRSVSVSGSWYGVVCDPKQAFLGVVDGLAHGEDKVWDCSCGSIHESKASLGDGHVQDQKGVLGDGSAAYEAGQEGVDHDIDSYQQGAYPVAPPFVVGLREAVHYFRAQEVGEFVDGALCEETKGGVGARNSFDRFGRVF